MKKLLFLLAACLCLASCVRRGITKVKDTGFGEGGEVWVMEFEYNGHKYLELKDNSQYGQGWVHDPDCPCFTQKKESDGLW